MLFDDDDDVVVGSVCGSGSSLFWRFFARIYYFAQFGNLFVVYTCVCAREYMLICCV